MEQIELSTRDREDLVKSYQLLEFPGLTARITNLIGQPLESAMGYLPKTWSEAVFNATRKALTRALDLVISRMDTHDVGRPSVNKRYKWLSGLSGAAGGAFGITALALELPVSTGIMLRTIADIARSEGENLDYVEGRLACLEVFALGGESKSDDGSETGYFGIRIALARSVSEAAQYIAARGLAEESAPALIRLISKIAARFSPVVAQKVAAQAVPVIGAAGGATVNVLFTEHFQKMAQGHFTVRRLERKYGEELVKAEYEKLKR